MIRPLRRLQGLWREHELIARRPARAVKRLASVQRYRLRSLL